MRSPHHLHDARRGDVPREGPGPGGPAAAGNHPRRGVLHPVSAPRPAARDAGGALLRVLPSFGQEDPGAGRIPVRADVGTRRGSAPAKASGRTLRTSGAASALPLLRTADAAPVHSPPAGDGAGSAEGWFPATMRIGMQCFTATTAAPAGSRKGPNPGRNPEEPPTRGGRNGLPPTQPSCQPRKIRAQTNQLGDPNQRSLNSSRIEPGLFNHGCSPRAHSSPWLHPILFGRPGSLVVVSPPASVAGASSPITCMRS